MEYIKSIWNLFNVDGTKAARKLYPILAGFSMNERFEFGLMDQQVRNRGINSEWKLTQDPPVATQI